MAYIYADNAATTRLSDTAFDAMKPFMLAEYGNASTLYKLGRSAHKAVENARGVFAKGINALPAEIYFTSGGTESDNWAIKGTAHRLAGSGKKHIVTDNIEHHAVLNSAKALEREGFEVTYVRADKNGLVRAEDVAAAIRPDTALVSVMLANNELGRSAVSLRRRAGSRHTADRRKGDEHRPFVNVGAQVPRPEGSRNNVCTPWVRTRNVY